MSSFVDAMNTKAKALGLTNTHFENPHGLHSENHYTTAKDMSIIAKELLKHEGILEFTSIYEDYLKKPDGSSIWLVNTNKLVRFYEGVDGLKTGFTDKAGYCITTTAKRNNLRLISVVMNASTPDERTKDTTNMLNYGFNTYKINNVLDNNNDFGNINIIKGEKLNTKIYLKENINILSKVSEKPENYHYNIKINNVKAPIKNNEKIGTVEILDSDNNIVKEEELIIKEDIIKMKFLTSFKRVINGFIKGII